MATRHQALADAVRARLDEGAGESDAALRLAVARRAAGGPPIDDPHETLARTIGEASFRVTDAQVAAVRAASGSDKAAFEIVMSACIGTGLVRWDNALRALEDASDAAR
jgi:hypothetical protein